MIETFKKIKRKINKYEKPDPKPHKVLSGLNRLPSTADMVKQLVQAELSAAAANQEYETFEEANDFDVSDGELPSQYELDDENPHNPAFVQEPAPESTTPQPDSDSNPQPVDNSSDS